MKTDVLVTQLELTIKEFVTNHSHSPQ